MSDRYVFDNEREQGYQCTPLLSSLSAQQERNLRIRLVKVLHETALSDRSFSETAGEIIKALREPLEGA